LALGTWSRSFESTVPYDYDTLLLDARKDEPEDKEKL
jgi:hypothetical protein